MKPGAASRAYRPAYASNASGSKSSGSYVADAAAGAPSSGSMWSPKKASAISRADAGTAGELVSTISPPPASG